MLKRDIDAEAVRLVQSMPNRILGKVDNKPVAYRYTIVVDFSFWRLGNKKGQVLKPDPTKS